MPALLLGCGNNRLRRSHRMAVRCPSQLSAPHHRHDALIRRAAILRPPRSSDTSPVATPCLRCAPRASPYRPQKCGRGQLSDPIHRFGFAMKVAYNCDPSCLTSAQPSTVQPVSVVQCPCPMKGRRYQTQPRASSSSILCIPAPSTIRMLCSP